MISIIIILLFFIIIKKVNTMFLLVYIKILELLFWFLFSFKNNKLVLEVFLVSIWSDFGKMMQFCHFFIKFLESN